MVKSAAQGVSMGVGVRVIAGERTGYAYSDDLSPEKIKKAARVAAHIASAQVDAEAATQEMRQSSCDKAEVTWTAINVRLESAQHAYDAAHGDVETDLKFEPSDFVQRSSIESRFALSAGTRIVTRSVPIRRTGSCTISLTTCTVVPVMSRWPRSDRCRRMPGRCRPDGAAGPAR